MFLGCNQSLRISLVRNIMMKILILNHQVFEITKDCPQKSKMTLIIFIRMKNKCGKSKMEKGKELFLGGSWQLLFRGMGTVF